MDTQTTATDRNGNTIHIGSFVSLADGPTYERVHGFTADGLIIHGKGRWETPSSNLTVR